MHSAIYTGQLQHRRHEPREHRFSYGLNMLYLDLAELDRVFEGRWFWSTRGPAPVRWRRGDHLGDPARPLDECARDLVEARTGERPAGAVRLLTHPRYFGYGFNPVSFLYCHDADDRLHSIVAEVNNTPWGERHPYVLPLASAEPKGHGYSWDLDKRMHVSPFHPMEHRYRWRFEAPDERLRVHMRNLDPADGRCVFDATLSLERREISGPALARALGSHPFMTLEVIWGIHWQALRLFLKGVPFHTHPAKRPVDGPASAGGGPDLDLEEDRWTA